MTKVPAPAWVCYVSLRLVHVVGLLVLSADISLRYADNPLLLRRVITRTGLYKRDVMV